MNTPVFVSKLMAKAFTNMIYKPSGFARPSSKTVLDRISKAVGMDVRAFYSTWPKEDFSLRNEDIEIPAEYHPIPNAKGVAILSHGLGQNMYAMLPHAKLFREMGYSTIIFDQRHFGKSKAPYGTLGVKEASDIVALIRWVKERCGADSKIVVLGASMGAAALMHALAMTDEIDAAVEDCGPGEMETLLDTMEQLFFKSPNVYLRETAYRESERFGAPLGKNRPLDSVAQSNTPLLVLHSEEDSTIPLQHAVNILAVAKNPLSRMKTFPGREHALGIRDTEKYQEALQDFLDAVFNDTVEEDVN